MNRHTPKRDSRNLDLPDSERKRRGKYTQVACNECKRRKLKCTGEDICRRCANNETPCVYPLQAMSTTVRDESHVGERSTSSQLRILEDRMVAMQQELRSMSIQIRDLQKAATPQNQTPHDTRSTPVNGGRWTYRPPMSPAYVGPTSGEFGLNVTDAVSDPHADETDHSEITNGGLTSESATPPQHEDTSFAPSNPLQALQKQDALRLVDVYEEAVGVLYPVVDTGSIRRFIVDYYRGGRGSEGAPSYNSPKAGAGNDWWFFARNVEVLKIVLAIALLAESHGRSELGACLAASVEETFGTRVKIPEIDMKEMIILVLVSLYHSYRDDDVIAWRMIGMCARGAMELGLHRSDTWLKTRGIFPGELQRSWAINLFWCVYVLDKEFSFETGLPFALLDSDMDTNLPEPAESTPYLTCMISYCRLGSKIWNLVVGWGSSPRAVTSDNCTYLDFQIRQWEDSIPHELRLDKDWPGWSASKTGDQLAMLQVLLCLRANQLRILIYKQNLLSSQSIAENLRGAKVAVDVARDTIQTLYHFSRVLPIYANRPEPFNHFLFSALAALFLAVFHAPEEFSQVCRSDFRRAIDTVKRSSTHGRTSRRLQKVIKNLKHIKRQLERAHGNGREAVQPSVNLDYQSAHELINADLVHTLPPSLVSEGELSGYADLTNFFELAGGYFMDSQLNVDASMGQSPDPSFQVQNSVDVFHAEDAAVTKLMMDLF